MREAKIIGEEAGDWKRREGKDVKEKEQNQLAYAISEYRDFQTKENGDIDERAKDVRADWDKAVEEELQQKAAHQAAAEMYDKMWEETKELNRMLKESKMQMLELNRKLNEEKIQMLEAKTDYLELKADFQAGIMRSTHDHEKMVQEHLNDHEEMTKGWQSQIKRSPTSN